VQHNPLLSPHRLRPPLCSCSNEEEKPEATAGFVMTGINVQVFQDKLVQQGLASLRASPSSACTVLWIIDTPIPVLRVSKEIRAETLEGLEFLHS